MKDSDIRAYAARDWTTAEDAKRRYWISIKRDMTPAEALAVAEDLRRFVEQLRPDFPTPEDRAADLETHCRVSEGLRSVAIRHS
jgi:hypothetical protein